MDKARLFHFIKQILISVGIGIVMLLVIVALFSLIVSKITAQDWIVNTLIIIAICMCSFISGFVGGVLRKEKGILVGLICGGVIAFILFILKLAFASDFFTVMSAFKLAVILIFSTVGGIVGVNKKSNKYAKIK